MSYEDKELDSLKEELKRLKAETNKILIAEQIKELQREKEILREEIKELEKEMLRKEIKELERACKIKKLKEELSTNKRVKFGECRIRFYYIEAPTNTVQPSSINSLKK